MKPIEPTPEKAVLIYNDCCPFCKDTAIWLNKKVNKDLVLVPNTEKWATELHPLLNKDNIKVNVHLVTMDRVQVEKHGHSTFYEWNHKNLYSAGEAVVYILSMKRGFGWIKYLYKLWPLNLLIELSYWTLKKTKKYYG